MSVSSYPLLPRTSSELKRAPNLALLPRSGRRLRRHGRDLCRPRVGRKGAIVERRGVGGRRAVARQRVDVRQGLSLGRRVGEAEVARFGDDSARDEIDCMGVRKGRGDGRLGADAPNEY